MKFGLRLHSLLVPEWCGFYIDYNGLRRKIRVLTHSEAEPQFSEVYNELSENIKSLQTFRQKKDQSLLQLEADLCDPKVLVDIPIIERKHFRIDLIIQSYQQIIDELKLLEWFDRVNEAAADKLFGKLAKHGQSATETYLHHLFHWERTRDETKICRLELHERINGLASQITSSLTAVQIGAPSLNHDQTLHIDPHTSEIWDKLYSTLKSDYVSLLLLQVAAATASTGVGQDFGVLPHHVFRLAATFSSDKTLELLMSDETLASKLNINSAFLSFFIRTTSYGEILETQDIQNDNSRSDQRDTSSYGLFNKMLSLLCSKAVPILQEKNASGCIPLHYAAKYGRSDICMTIAAVLAETADPCDRIRVLTSIDNDDLTPLHYAVVGNHLSTLETLLDALFQASIVSGTSSDTKSLLGDLLLLALQAQKDEIVLLLLDKGPDLSRRTIHGESALYVAAQTGRSDYVKLLLNDCTESGSEIDLPDRTLGWTALMVACANGYKEIAEHLLSAGANKATSDPLGWTAQEHSAFRGHLAVSELFGMAKTASTADGPADSSRVEHNKRKRLCCAGQKLIIVVIGSVQGGHDRAAVELDGLVHKAGKLRQPHPTLLEVSTLGVEGQDQELCLPLLEDQVNNPIVFQVKEDTLPQLVVRIFRSGTTAAKILVGSGTVLLDQGNRLLGSKRETLLRERTVVILGKEDMRPVGTVQVSYVIAGSFPNLQHGNPPSYSRLPGEPIRVFGHRGSGMNIGGHSYLQLGENTAMSLLSAVNLGASFVEFDVQVTRDLEPVIYHNFSVSESGTEIPIHDMTLDQFIHACESQEPRDNPAMDASNQGQSLPSKLRRLRSGSMGNRAGPEAALMRERLQYTVSFKKSGFKANTRGSFIQDSLATLEDLLVKLPPHAGFNIEIKYSRLHEAAEAGMAPIAMELNLFVDTILQKVHQFANGRPIILSSFTPAVCMLLAIKQQAYPVMFITNAGKVPMLDQEVRAASLQIAVKFAKRWGLSGLVLACDVVLHCPRLVQFVNLSGLVCATYGAQNSVPAMAKLQEDAGVDIIITDRVKLISQTLNSSPSSC